MVPEQLYTPMFFPNSQRQKSATVLSDKNPQESLSQRPEKVLGPRRSRPVVRLVPSKPIYNGTRGVCPTNSTFQVASHSESCRCVGLWVKEPRPMFMQKVKAGLGVSRCLPQGTHPHKSLEFPQETKWQQQSSDPSICSISLGTSYTIIHYTSWASWNTVYKHRLGNPPSWT